MKHLCSECGKEEAEYAYDRGMPYAPEWYGLCAACAAGLVDDGEIKQGDLITVDEERKREKRGEDV